MKKTIREELIEYIVAEYHAEAEHPWASYPNYIIFRHEDPKVSEAEYDGDEKAVQALKNFDPTMLLGNPEFEEEEQSGKNVHRRYQNKKSAGKWFAIMMQVQRKTLGLPGEGSIDIMNVKLDPEMVDLLRTQAGYLPGYHMNKKYWLTVLLDGSVPMENIQNLLGQSFEITAGKKGKKRAVRGPKDWLIPANPKYYDLISAFAQEDIIDWKQSSDVHVGDMIYMYVAAPYSAVLYKCKAVEVNIPCNFKSEYITLKTLMRIQKLHQYPADFMTFDRLKNEFGVYAVRGPRSVPNSLKEELDMFAK